MNPETKTVLVIGATGAQGGAVARTLHDAGHRVRALTRNPQSSHARSLSRRGMQVFSGDFDDPETIANAAHGTEAAFIMGTPFEADTEAEVRQTTNTIDAVSDAGVRHIVYSSVASAHANTGVPHFESKAAIEHHLDRLEVPQTVVAPTAFLSDLTGSPFWEGLQPGSWDGIRDGVYAFALPAETRLQMVSLIDLSQFVQLVIENPNRFDRCRVEIASVEVSGAEIVAHLSRCLDKKVRYQQVPLDVLERIAGEDSLKMTQFFLRRGYTVDIPSLHALYPEIRWHSVQNWIDSHEWAQVLGRFPTPEANPVAQKHK